MAEETELIAGGGGRPGVDLIGGGRRGRSFILDGLKRKKVEKKVLIFLIALYDPTIKLLNLLPWR